MTDVVSIGCGAGRHEIALVLARVTSIALACIIAGCGDGSGNGASGPVFGASGPQSAFAASCAGADLSVLKSAVYVKANGTEGPSCGATTANACKSIQQGIANCAVGACGVLVRHGLYPTTATIALRDGVSVYGSCRFDGEADHRYRTTVQAAPAPGTPAISAAAINTPTTVQGLVVIGKDETASGTASIAMAISASKGITVANVVLAAGRGGDGANGASAQAGQGQDGFPANDSQGGPGASGGVACLANPSAAGAGGQGGDGEQGGLGFPDFCFITCPCAYPNAASAAGRSGGASGSVSGAGGGGAPFGGEYCTGPAFGGDFENKGGGTGSPGACSTQGGVPSANLWGSASQVAWLPSAGAAGGSGEVGSGGGGGGSGGLCVGFPDGLHPRFVEGAPGGGAGGGGCGGPGGQGGQQGGASIALILLESAFTASPTLSVIAGPGGKGGSGVEGAPGGAGGTGAPGGAGHQAAVGSSSCPGTGGRGGNGGQGGASGGGAGGNGGPSIGIALTGSSPAPGDGGIYLGKPGLGGTQGGGGMNPNCTGAAGAGGVGGGAAVVVNLDAPSPGILSAGQSLAMGQKLFSPKSLYFLIMQTDSNLVVYTAGGGYVWDTKTEGSGAVRAVMQTDGNLVVYRSDDSVAFASNTVGHPGAYLIVQDDGHVQIIDGSSLLWTQP